MRVRRIGSLTLGGGLIVFGILFLVHVFWKDLSYMSIFRLWPCLLISLGVETLLGRNGENWVYDKGAVILLFLVSIFSMCMAGVQFFLETGMQWASIQIM